MHYVHIILSSLRAQDLHSMGHNKHYYSYK